MAVMSGFSCLTVGPTKPPGRKDRRFEYACITAVSQNTLGGTSKMNTPGEPVIGFIGRLRPFFAGSSVVPAEPSVFNRLVFLNTAVFIEDKQFDFGGEQYAEISEILVT